MVAMNQAWLDQVEEEVLEPALPICDPHHHLWDFRSERVEPRYLIDEILADTNTGHNIVSTVFIECGAMWKADGPEDMRYIGETEFVNGIAAASASGLYGDCRVAAGIVGTVDFTTGEAVRPVLERHVELGGGRFRGIRHGVTWDASDDVPNGRGPRPPHLYLDPNYREGAAQLAQFDLSFEAWCYHPQIPELTEFVQTIPNTTVILDHFGGPLGIGPYAGREDEVFEVWRKDIAELAKSDNVVAKLGGINMVLNGFGWHERARPPGSEELCEATRRYYDYTLEQFGVDRCLFESNFPVDKESCGYNVLWNSFKRLTKDYSADEKRKLYHDNAVRTYRL